MRSAGLGLGSPPSALSLTIQWKHEDSASTAEFSCPPLRPGCRASGQNRRRGGGTGSLGPLSQRRPGEALTGPVTGTVTMTGRLSYWDCRSPGPGRRGDW